MLLLWSRLSALALMASLATCSPVAASLLNAAVTIPPLELVPGREQVANFTKRPISGPPTLDYIPTSILTKGVSHTIVLPHITLPSGHGPYKEEDTINLKWKRTKYPKYADLWFEVSGNAGPGVTVQAQGVMVYRMPLEKGSYDIVGLKTLTSAAQTSAARKKVENFEAHVIFVLPANNQHKGNAVIGPLSDYFIMQTDV